MKLEAISSAQLPQDNAPGRGVARAQVFASWCLCLKLECDGVCFTAETGMFVSLLRDGPAGRAQACKVGLA